MTAEKVVRCPDCEWAPKKGQLWPTEGPVAVKWFKKNLILPEGSTFGQPFIPRPDQKKFIYSWYEYCGRCDRWRYKEALRGEATGGGKTTLLAGVAMLEFAGPEGIAPISPNIVVAAASRGQANNLFRKVGQMAGGRDDAIRESPLCGLFHVFENEIRFKDGRPGMIERVAAEAGTNEGGFPSLFICDELHEWTGNIARNKTVIGKSTNKREDLRGEGRVLGISTAGFDKNNCLLGTMYKKGKQVEHDPTIDPKYYFTWYEADEDLNPDDPNDRREMIKQASPAAGVIWSIEARVRAWKQPDMPPHEWLRYYANRWVDVGMNSWLKDHPGVWKSCKGEWESSDSNPFTIGVDMALRHDTVGVVRCEKLPNDRVAISHKIWRADQVTGRIDHSDVWNYILSIAKGEGFRGVVYDPRYFELPARMLEERGVLAIQFDQTPTRLAPASGLAYKRIIENTIIHNGDPDLADQVNSAVTKYVERGGFYVHKGVSKRNIDACVAMCMALYELEQALEVKPFSIQSDGAGSFWRPAATNWGSRTSMWG